MTEILKLCHIAIVACFDSVYELWIALSIVFRNDCCLAFVHLAVATLSPEVAGVKRFTDPLLWFRSDNVIENAVAQHAWRTRAQLSWHLVVTLFNKNDSESMAKLVGMCILPLLLSFGVLRWAKKRFGDSHEWIWHTSLTWMLFGRFLCAVDDVQRSGLFCVAEMLVMATLVKLSVVRFQGVAGVNTLFLLPICTCLCVILNRISVGVIDAFEPDKVEELFTEVFRKLLPVVYSFCFTKLFPVKSAFRVNALTRNNVGVLLYIHILLPAIQMNVGADEGCEDFSLRFEKMVYSHVSTMSFTLAWFGCFRMLSCLHSSVAVRLSSGESRRELTQNGWASSMFFFCYVLWLCLVRCMVLVVNHSSSPMCLGSSAQQHNVKEGFAYLGSLADVLSSVVMWWTVENSLKGSESVSALSIFVSALSPVETIFSWYASIELLKAAWYHQGILAVLRYFGAAWGLRAGSVALHGQQAPSVWSPGVVDGISDHGAAGAALPLKTRGRRSASRSRDRSAQQSGAPSRVTRSQSRRRS